MSGFWIMVGLLGLAHGIERGLTDLARAIVRRGS